MTHAARSTDRSVPTQSEIAASASSFGSWCTAVCTVTSAPVVTVSVTTTTCMSKSRRERLLPLQGARRSGTFTSCHGVFAASLDHKDHNAQKGQNGDILRPPP